MQILEATRDPVRQVHAIAFSPDGRLLAVGGTSGTTGKGGRVHLWDLSTCKSTVCLKGTGGPYRFVGFTIDGQYLVGATENRLRRRHLESGREVEQRFGIRFKGWGMHPARGLFAAVGNGLEAWQVPDLDPDKAVIDRRLLATVFRSLAFRHLEGIILGSFGAVWFADRVSLEAAKPVAVRASYVTQLALSPDESLLAGADESQLHIWEMSPEGPRLVANPGPGSCTGFAFHPSGRFLAAAHEDDLVRFWAGDGWHELAAFSWDVGRFLRLAFAPDGLRIAAAGDGGRIVVWDVDG